MNSVGLRCDMIKACSELDWSWLFDVNLLPEKLCQIDYWEIEQHLHLFSLGNAMEDIE